MSDIETIVLPEVALHLDVRYFPVLTATWFGALNETIINRYADWLDAMAARAKAEETKLVILGDTAGITEQPGPEMRKIVANAIDRVSSNNSGVFLGGTIVIGNPVMRAEIFMVVAITRRKCMLRPAENIELAIERTLELLDKAGIPQPEGFDAENYRRPKQILSSLL